MSAKKHQVVLGETTYNLVITPDRVWLEDDLLKLQWEWNEAPEHMRALHDLPNALFLLPAKDACEHGGKTADCVVAVEAAETEGDLVLRVDAKIGCGDVKIDMTRVFELEAVPLTSEQLVDAKIADLREQIEALKQQAEGAQTQIQELEQQVTDAQVQMQHFETQSAKDKAQIARLQEEADKPWWQKLWEWVRRIVREATDYGQQALATAKSTVRTALTQAVEALEMAASTAWQVLCKLALVVVEWMTVTDEPPPCYTVVMPKRV